MSSDVIDKECTNNILVVCIGDCVASFASEKAWVWLLSSENNGFGGGTNRKGGEIKWVYRVGC